MSDIKIGDIWEGSSTMSPPDWNSSIKFKVQTIDADNIVTGVVVDNTIDPFKRPIGSEYVRSSVFILDMFFWRRVYRHKIICEKCRIYYNSMFLQYVYFTI